jgi:hypothetical protein
MHPIMRATARALLVPAVAAGLLLGAPQRAQAQDNTGCVNANGLNGSFPLSGTINLASVPGGFIAGQVITVTFTMNSDGLAVPYQVTGPDGSPFLAFPANGTTTVVTINNPTQINGNIAVDSAFNGNSSGSVTISCLIAGSSSGSSAAFQNAINAQVAISNGKLVLQQTSDAVKLGVLQSLAAGTSSQGARAGGGDDRVEKLANEQAELTHELDALPAADVGRRRDLERKLALSRSNLAFARDEARSMKVRGAAGSDEAADRPVDNRERKPSDGSAAMHVNAASLADACTTDCDPTGTRWNAWIDGRLIGATDSAAQQSTFGFIGVGGVDYKLQPWLALGVSLGTETFTNKLGTSGIRVAQNGFSLAPYVGVRLDPNVFLAGFAGFSHLNYNNTPLPGLTAQFEAWRFIAGGSLTGVWQYGPWRLQPSVDVAYGSENQAGYTDSAGTAVPGQIVTYGRVWGGPEIGYRFDSPGRSWSVEPFVLARATIDFASNNQLVVGQGTMLRGQGSGGAGVGVQILGNGFNVRVDVTYDSIGVSGLDLWTGRLRGGWSF